MAKTIKIEEVQNSTKEIYELCSEISILQKELDQMLMAIEKNSRDYAAGKISKDLFKYNDGKMKKECAKNIKAINSFVGKSSSMILRMGKDIESQKIVQRKPRKKSLNDIKKITQPSQEKIQKGS
jgi:hypothetical protein